MGWDELSPQARARTETIRTAEGEALYLDQDLFVRQAFTGGVLTPVSEQDLEAYLAPYPTRESRRPLLAWARQMPLGGEPAGLIPRIEAYDAWLAASPQVPKLMMTFEGSPDAAQRQRRRTGARATSPRWRPSTAARPGTTRQRTVPPRSPPPSRPGRTVTGCARAPRLTPGPRTPTRRRPCCLSAPSPRAGTRWSGTAQALSHRHRQRLVEAEDHHGEVVPRDRPLVVLRAVVQRV